MKRWPNFFIVGTGKAGTTSLYWYLKKIPDIYMSEIKEPNFFSAKTISKDYLVGPIRNEKKYLALFTKGKQQKILGDASPQYLNDPEAPYLIHKVSPNAKILITLRNPIERTFSSYLAKVRNGWTSDSFNKSIVNELKNYELKEQKLRTKPVLRIDGGLYYDGVKRYLDTFGKDQVKIIIFEEFIKEPKKTVKEILEFLEIDSKLENFKEEILNPYSVGKNGLSRYFLRNRTAAKILQKITNASVRRFLKEDLLTKKQPKPKMELQDREMLKEFYTNDVKKIKTILDRQLPWVDF